MEEEGIVKCVMNDSAFTLKAQVVEKAPSGKEIPPCRSKQSVHALPSGSKMLNARVTASTRTSSTSFRA